MADSNGERFMAFDVISEIGFGAPFGFVETSSDIGGLIQGLRNGLPIFGLLARMYPLTYWIKKTWMGDKYLVSKPNDKSGFGVMMHFRDKLIAQRVEEIKTGKSDHKVDLLQKYLGLHSSAVML